MQKDPESVVIGNFTLEEIQRARAAVFDTAVDIMYLFDVDTLQILDMNPSGLRQLGYTIEEVRRKDFFGLHALEEHERVAEIIAIYKREGAIYYVSDLHLRRKDGSLIPVEKNGKITYVDGKPLGH